MDIEDLIVSIYAPPPPLDVEFVVLHEVKRQFRSVKTFIPTQYIAPPQLEVVRQVPNVHPVIVTVLVE